MARNVAVNPSAANDLTRWTLTGSNAQRNTDFVGTPKPTGASVTSGSGAYSASIGAGGAATSATGVAWTISGWVRTTVARTMRCYMSAYNNDSFVATQNTGLRDISVPANTWTEVFLTQNTPSGTYNNIRFHVDIPTAAGVSTISLSSVRLDNVSESPFPYRDGDYPGWSWGGTPGSSISTGEDVFIEPGRFLIAF